MIPGTAITLVIALFSEAWSQVLPDQVDLVDARSLGLANSVVAGFEAGTGAAANPATLESVDRPLVAVSGVSRLRSQSLTEVEMMAAAPYRDWALAVTARGGWGLYGAETDEEGTNVGGLPVRIAAVGARAAVTPMPVLSAGLGARVARVVAANAPVVTRPIVDAGMVLRPEGVPGLAVGAATLGFGAAPELQLGASLSLDEELLGPKRPPVVLLMQGGWSAEGGNTASGAMELWPVHLLAVRLGMAVDTSGVTGAVGLGVRTQRFCLDWTTTRAPTVYSPEGFWQMRHAATVAVRGAPKRTRALATLRGEREDAHALELTEAARRASESTSRQFAEATLSRVERFVDELEVLGALERARARQLLDEARANIERGLWDVGQEMALDVWDLVRLHVEAVEEARRAAEEARASAEAERESTQTALEAERLRAAAEAERVASLQASMDDLEASYLLARRQAERGQRPAPESDVVVPDRVVPEADRAAAERLFLEGMDLYTRDAFSAAAEKWRQAAELNPQLHAIEAHIANAETKARTLAELGGP